jgi:hypothetical protein
MEKKGYLQHFVQQNHDGLPQKAGYPQEKINEIHGAWFDPSNPVIQFSGNLRDDYFADMLKIEEKATLCLCLGTSLSGMNADRCAFTPAEKAASGVDGVQGTVMVNLQRTGMDTKGLCSVRVWSLLDEFFKLLAVELELDVKPKPQNRMTFKLNEHKDVFKIPYNAKGNYDPTSLMTLDLREGQRVKIAPKSACNYNKTGVVMGKDKFGNYLINLQGTTYVKRLGRWWLRSALDGSVPNIPLINRVPVTRKVDVQP